MSGLEMSAITHEQGGPWRVTKKEYGDKRHVVIPNRLIREFFKRKLDENRRRAAEQEQR